MNKLPSICLAAALLSSGAMAQKGQLDALREKLDAIGNLRIDTTNFEITKEGNAVIKPRDGLLHFESDGMEVFAGKAEYFAATEQLRFTGDVAIYREGLIYRGEKASYNISTRQLDAAGMRSSVEPLFFKAANISSISGDISVINLNAAEFTTEDNDDPGFRLTADNVSIYPGDRVVFRKVKILSGDTPIFYLPYLTQTLDGELAYSAVPGYRDNLGVFLLNQYNTTIGDHSLIKYRFDLYSARGAGAGFDLTSRRFPKDSKFGKFKFYWLYDSDPQRSHRFGEPSREGVDSSRYRVNLQHRVYLPGPEQGDLYVDIDLNKISDEFLYEDFFRPEFRDDPQPDNIINLVKRHERGELNLYGRFRVNDFYQTDTRLPEISLDRVRQPVFNTGLFYSGSSSFGRLEEHLGDDDQRRIESAITVVENNLVDPAQAANIPSNTAQLAALRASLIEPAFSRSHLFNELYYPMTFAGAITVTPRAGIGYTGYSHISGPHPLDSSRLLFSAGIDTSFKMSRVYDDFVIPSLGIDGLRHIVQPYVNWSYVSTDDLGSGFPGIDHLAPSTRPRPLEVSNFSAIDSLRDWNIVRAGVYNRLQTRRNHATWNWLTTNTYIDAFIDDPEFGRDFSNLYQDVEWRPVPWAKLSVGAQAPIGNDPANFSEFNTRATFMPTDSVELSVGHRLLRGHPIFQDSNLIDFGAYTRLGENWGFSIYERYEMEDHTLETQQYSIHRDLTNWVASAGAIIRDYRGQNEWGLLLSLTLKDFPSVRLPVDFDPGGGRQ